MGLSPKAQSPSRLSGCLWFQQAHCVLICKGACWRMRSATQLVLEWALFVCLAGWLTVPVTGRLDASVMRWNRVASPAAAASLGAQACTAGRKITLLTHPRQANMLTVRVWMVHALCVQRRHDCTASLLDDCVCVCNAVIDPGGPPLARNAANPARLRGFGLE